MKKLVLILSTLLFLIGTTDVQAQWGKKLLKKAGESAKRATERNVEKKIDKTVDKAFDGAEDAVTGKGNKDNGEKKAKTSEQGNVEATEDGGDVAQEQQEQPQQSLEMTYAKSDFVPGDEIFFEDNQANEQMGEFPSQWDLVSGNAEIASIGSAKCIYLIDDYTTIAPLMKNMKNYLPDKFTVEFDYLPRDNAHEKGMNQYLEIGFNTEAGKRAFRARWYPCASRDYLWTNWVTPSDESRSANSNELKVKGEEWVHVAISFNQRALKVYFDGVRKANIPNVTKPASLYIWMSHSGGENMFYIKNFRLAKGAVPLYDRMMTNGKFITYGITFDVGKSTIKPESMGEINRIVKLMTDNPDLKFSVEGHTDSTGNEASNQTLSEARSKAIVDKLVELGIAADRLSASGKGQSSPIADNGTDEGRAKNRRVEFVKQ